MIRIYLFVIGTLALLGFVGFATHMTARILRTLRLDFNPILHPLQAGTYLVLCICCISLGWLSGLPPAQLGWATRDWPLDLGLGLAVGVLLPLVINPLLLAAIHRWGPQIYSPALMRALLPRSRRDWLCTPWAVILVILSEELLFRSLWVGGMSVFVSPWILALVGSFLFGLMHNVQGRLGMVITGVVGFILSVLFIWRGSLLPVAIAHYVTDMVQIMYSSRRRAWLESYPES